MIIDDLSDIERAFTYHTPNEAQALRLENVRNGVKEFAKIILINVPNSADRSAAFRKLRECVMTLNASIILDPSIKERDVTITPPGLTIGSVLDFRTITAVQTPHYDSEQNVLHVPTPPTP